MPVGMPDSECIAPPSRLMQKYLQVHFIAYNTEQKRGKN